VSQCHFWSPQITKRLGLTGYQLSQSEPLPRTYIRLLANQGQQNYLK